MLGISLNVNTDSGERERSCVDASENASRF